MSNDQEDDLSVFRQAMKDVRRLDNDKRVIRKPPPAPTPKQTLLDEQAALDEMANGGEFDQDLEYGDEASYKRPEIPRTVMRRLRRGMFAIQGEIDLHGHTAVEAKSALAEFLNASHLSGHHCVRVIHGKGHRSPGKLPVLKPKVVKWLAQRDDIAAFVSARAVDGGTGALYVLLR